VSRRGHDAWNPTLLRGHPSGDFGEGKMGALPRDHDVAIADELRAAAKADSVHGRDERFGERPPSRNGREA
jgi:hypothetical protein